ncbi:hypothetical protein RB594_006964 [Gaeumannomyces avenae]
MAPEQKRNHFLDANESDDDQSQGYNSEADEISKGRRSAKRRKLDSDNEDDGDLSGDDDDDGSDDQHVESPGAQLHSEALESALDDSRPHTAEGEGKDEDDGGEEARPGKKNLKSQPQLRQANANPTKKNLVVTEAQVKRSGVVYLPRIPPFMKPAKLRSLLEPYGRMNRIFLSPEDPAARSRRVRAGGNKKRSFTDGWVEFVRKADAKAVAATLNGQTIGGKKGSYYRDDVWTMLYLKGFKWHNLTEQIASENAERASRMRAEISKSTRENRDFVRNAERAKVLDGMQAKKAAKQHQKPQDGGRDASGAAAAPEAAKSAEPARTFRQVPVAEKKNPVDSAQRTLGKFF